ncbi:MAG: 4-hydroxybutyrate CoA-transferase [Chloroflexi bacterium]|nr:4-hydroxybutyrate CoA-transferase [Chloroflexota bacterium]
MADWKEYYRSRTVSPEQAVAVIKSGDRVAFTTGNEPTALALALLARAPELRGVTLFLPTPSRDFGWYEPGFEENFTVEVGYILPVVREMVAQRRCDYNVQTMRVEYGPFDRPADVVMVELSPPDEHGFCSFGASLWNKKQEVRSAKVALAEVNDKLIRTAGENFIHVSEIDQFVPHVSSGRAPGATDLLGRKAAEPGLMEKTIAKHVAALIRDGDTLQIGVGSTSEWVARLGVLEAKNDLGWHSETTPRGVIGLVRQGIITGARKTKHAGKVVATAIGGGSADDMAFVDSNAMFELHPAEYVIDSRTIAGHDNMVAINSAVAVDLTGQIAAESLGHTMLSGSGGHLSFAIGANLSKGGRYIVVMPSTAQGGKRSRIVPAHETGTVVTVSRTLAQYVVTEHGVSDLRGKTQRQRAEALIEVAHPEFRVELRAKARKLYWP